MHIWVKVWLSLALMGLVSGFACAQNTIHIYIDADRTNAKSSGIAIERGIRVALDEVNNQIAGHSVKLIIRDHHGSAVRSKGHLKEYLEDSNALVVFGGLHSPPLLENLKFIHDNKILVLAPWAAAGPITRYPSEENWVFRLSVDDSKAGKVIVDHALKEGFKRPYLLLEETGWGKSNYKTMTMALAQKGMIPEGVKWFNWSLGSTGAKILLRDIYASEADVILMVANAPEGKTFAEVSLILATEFSNRNPIPIRSHWGITGGDFPKVVDAKMREKLDLKFLQTRFSFVSSEPTELSKAVLERTKKLFPDKIKSAADITAPTGFIHAYDLTRLLITALSETGMSGDPLKDRASLRKALENLKQPVTGLIKTYKQPFSPFNKQTPDAHEALNSEDLVMGAFDKDNRIIIMGEP